MTQQNQDFLTDGELSLADLENGSNPILDRVKQRLLNEASGSDAHM